MLHHTDVQRRIIIGDYTYTFIRMAKKRIDGWDGFLYLQNWKTGYQYLITQRPIVKSTKR